MADFGGSDPPPDRNGGKGREEVKKNGSQGEGKSQTEVFLPPDIGASGSRFVQKSSQEVKDESSEPTGSESGDPGAKSIQNPNTGMKNKNQNRQRNREQMGHVGKKPDPFIAAMAQNFTGDQTGVHKAEKPQKQQTAESNDPESHLNKEDTKAKAASYKQESFRPESKDGRGTHGSQAVRVGPKNNQEHLHREQRPEKMYSKQNREGTDDHEAKVSYVSVTGKQSDKGEHGSPLSDSFCVIRDEDIPIVVKTITGKEITINGRLSDTIEKVKVKIEDMNGIAPDDQRLMYDGMELLEGNTLLHYSINKNSTIQLVVKLEKGQEHNSQGSKNTEKQKIEVVSADTSAIKLEESNDGSLENDGNRAEVDKDRGMSDSSTRDLGVSKNHLQEKTENLNEKKEVNEEIVEGQPDISKSPAVSTQKLGESNEHKADDKDKNDLEDKIEHEKEDMQSTGHASVTPKEDFQKTAEDKGGTKHDDSAGQENSSMDSKVSGKQKVEAAPADTSANKVEPSDESIEKGCADETGNKKTMPPAAPPRRKDAKKASDSKLQGPDKKDLGNREALSDDSYMPIPKKRNLPKTPPSDYRKREKDKNDQSVVRKGSSTLEEHKSKTEPTIDVGGIAAKGAVPETGKGESDEEGERKFQNVFDDSTDSGTQAALSESGSFEVLTSAITEEESQMEDTRYSSIDPPVGPMLEETIREHVISYTDNCKSQKEEDIMSPGAEVYQHTSTSVAQNSGMSEPEKNETLKYELKKINGRYFLKKGSEKKVLPEKFDHAKEVSLNDDDLVFADRKCYRITEKDGCLVLVDIDEVPCIERQTQPPMNADTVPTSSLLQKFPTSEKCKPNSDIHSDSEMKSEIEIQKRSKDKDGRNVWNNSAKGNTPCERKCGINSTSIEETQTEVDELTKKLASININEEQRQEQKQNGKMHEISAKVIAQGNVKCYPIMCKLEAKLRWMYLACKPERFTEVMNKVEIPDLELRLEKETLLVILRKRVEEKRVIEILQEIKKQIVGATTDLTVNKYNPAEIEAEDILNELKLSKLVSNGSMFVTVREKNLIFVCHSELCEEAYKECSAAEERFWLCNTETVEYPVGFEMVIGHYKMQDVIENAFPKLKILCKVNDKKQKCECKLTGDVTCLEKARLFLKEKVFDKYTANRITLKKVKNFEWLQKAAAEAFQSYLEMKIEHIIHAEKLQEPTDVFFRVGNRDIIIVGSLQKDIDTVVHKVTNCVAHMEVTLDSSNTIQENLVSKTVDQNKEKVFTFQTEGKLHFVGSLDIVHRAVSEYTEKASTRHQQSQPKARTVEVDDSGVYYYLKSTYQRDTYLSDIKGVTIVPVEKDKRSGFVIHSTDEDKMIKAEQRLKSMIADVKEDTMTLNIQNGRDDQVDDLIKVVEQDIKVKIIKRKAVVPKKEAQSGTDGKDDIPSSKQRTWKFPGNHTVKITYGKAEHSWQDLLVEFLASSSKQEERKRKIDIIPVDSEKKKALLNIPLKDEGGKDKHRVADVVEEMLVESKKADCTHVSLALNNRGCWPLKVFLKRLLKPIFAHLKEDLLPVTVEMCIEREEEFFECLEIAQESMPLSAKEEMLDVLSKDSAILPVKVIKGNLTDMEADVYVNPSSPDLTFDGAVSRSILIKAGPDLKKECERKYRDGIADWDICVTHGFKLRCQVVFHGALKRCSGPESLKSMKDFVIRCLELAKRLGKQSIAFPLIGTGGLSYNVQDVADVMFAAVRLFAKKHGTHTCLKRVLFVAYTTDFSGFKVMRDKEEAEKKEIMQALQQKHQFQGLQVNVGRFKLKVQEGSLSSFVDEDGIIYLWDRALWTQVPGSTHVLLKEAGKDIERQFFLHRDGPERQKLFSTTGGKLGVKNIIHVPSENKAENLFMSLRGGLKMADENQLAHVAVFLDKKSKGIVFTSYCLIQQIHNRVFL